MGEEADLDQITEMLEGSNSNTDELAELNSEAREEKPQKLYDDPITEDYKTKANNNKGGRTWHQDKDLFRLTVLK